MMNSTDDKDLTRPPRPERDPPEPPKFLGPEIQIKRDEEVKDSQNIIDDGARKCLPQSTEARKQTSDKASMSQSSGKTIEGLEREIANLRKQVETLNGSLLKEKDSNKEMGERIEHLTQAKDKIAKDLEAKCASELDLQDRLKVEKGEAKKLENDNARLQKQLQEEREKSKTRLNELSCLRDANNRADKTVKELREKIDELEKQLSVVKSRLSKEIGDKVSNANPDLADLSDSKRPTKIGERYQELYDNQWTDAFETAVKQFTDNAETNPERSAIDLLLTILKNCYKICAEEYEMQARLLVKLLATDKTDFDASLELKKRFKAARRINGKQDAASICKKYLASLNAKNTDEKIVLDVRGFVNECVEVCWMMVIQDPQVVLHKEAVQFDTFNSNLYRAYTVSGKKVDFVVWPALLLHTEGAPLAKGIAQCVKEEQDNSDVRSTKKDNKERAPSPQEVSKADQNIKEGTEGKLEGKEVTKSAKNANVSLTKETGKNDNIGKTFTDTNAAKQKEQGPESKKDKEKPPVSSLRESKKEEKQDIQNPNNKNTPDTAKAKMSVKDLKSLFEC